MGASLPSESSLSAEFEVSRGPVRQALGTLRNEGLIELAQGKPAVVRSRDARQTLDTFTPFSQWARRSGRLPGSRTIEIAKRLPREETAVALELGPGDHVVEILRLRLLDGQPTMIERSTFVDRVGSLLFDLALDAGSITDFLTSRGIRFDQMEHVLDPGSPLLK